MLAVHSVLLPSVLYSVRVFNTEATEPAKTMRIDDQTPLLAAIESEGLLPPSRCRRGSCLECAARLIAGSPFSLRVDDSALCEAARNDGLFLLCSAYVTGDGVEIALDQHADAMEAMYRRRFLESTDVERGVVQVPPAQYAHADLVEHVERCFDGGARD